MRKRENFLEQYEKDEVWEVGDYESPEEDGDLEFEELGESVEDGGIQYDRLEDTAEIGNIEMQVGNLEDVEIRRPPVKQPESDLEEIEYYEESDRYTEYAERYTEEEINPQAQEKSVTAQPEEAVTAQPEEAEEDYEFQFLEEPGKTSTGKEVRGEESVEDLGGEYVESEADYGEEYKESEADYGEEYEEFEEDFGEEYEEPMEDLGAGYAEPVADFDGGYEESAEGFDEEYEEFEEDLDEEYEEFEDDEEGLELYDAEEKPAAYVKSTEKREKKSAFLRMSVMDRIMLLAGTGVLVLAIITGTIYVNAKNLNKQVLDFATVGTQLEGIEVIGDQGLLAVADSTAAKLAALEIIEQQPEETEPDQEPPKGYEEVDYSQAVTVTLKMVSVQKDLKIKFVNSGTGKLISNVPFSVTVVTADNKTEIWSDDDMDGIIYKKGITPGNYKVTAENLSDDKYAKYKMPEDTQKVEVKKDIAYKKIDVSDEVKTESQIDLSKEEQKKKGLEVESSLTDTVKWVESTAVPSTYIEVAKSNITDPRTVVKAGNFMRMANEVTLSANTASLQVGGAALTLTATHSLGSDASIVWSSTNPGVASVQDGVVSPKAVGSAVIICTVTGSPTASGGNANVSYSATCNVTVAEAGAAGAVSVDPANVMVALNKTTTAKIVTSGFTEGKALKYEAVAANPGIATVVLDAGGNMTIAGVTVGTTTVTVTANYLENPLATAPSAVYNVTVSEMHSVSLDKTAATVYLTEPAEIIATVQNALTTAAVTAKSSDESIATVEVTEDRKIIVTGVNVGTANITVEYLESDVVSSAVCAVTVKKHPKEDKETKLKDNSGNQLYVLENEEYREAVYADYYKEDIKFFKKGDTKYTGWNTIDGKVYFFDASGNKVTGEQVIQGAKYNFASDGSLVTGSGTLGIDVSKHNGTIDWNAVKNSGVSYVIIRCGYRGYTQGSLIVDPKFQQNVKGATAAGLKVGVYFFSQAVDEVEAVQEASFVLDAVKGHTISYPIFLDVEPSGASGNKGRADKLDVATRTAVCKAFCATIQSGGYTAGVYANKTWLQTKIDPAQLGSYKIWLAQYAASPTYSGRYDLWQYKDTGKVSGISGNVDMNLSYLGY